MTAESLTAKLAPVLLGIHIVALPLYPHMPMSVLLLTAVFTVWTWLMIIGRVRQPGRFVMVFLTIMVVIVLVQSFGTILGQLPGSAMLLLLAFLKLFEMKTTKDIAIVIFLGFFLVASKFFYSQSVLIAVHVFVVVVYLTSLLIVYSDRLGTTRFYQRIGSSFRMIMLAVPLMLILFILFPRVPGPLWGLPTDTQSASTGLSEEMSPGSINHLVGSGEVAFRVKFEGEPPPRSLLYWRGLVLSNYDGRTWRLDNAPPGAVPLIVAGGNQNAAYSYTVTLEPHNQHWLYALESLVEYDRRFVVTREMHLVAASKITDTMSYSLVSDVDAKNGGLFEPEREKNLALPEGLNKRAVEFAESLFAESNHENSSYINNVLKHFAAGEFVYTLTPPMLGANAMDEFLFGARRGFCEHYSSAFVYLMRAAGIPSRVVVGYQGGEMHPFDDYMIVRQSDAHAWAEVWLEDQGWIRIDPTAAVSPTRIENGIENAGLERAQLPGILVSDNAMLQSARFLLDSFHNSWNQWVIGFNHERQKELFGMLGMDNITTGDLVIGLVILMTFAGGMLAWWVIRGAPMQKQDTVSLYFDRFCRKLDKVGIMRQAHEGADDLLVRAVKALPARRSELTMITRSYQCLRYGNDANKQRLGDYIRAVRRFKAR